jgi:hypothetical protein
MTVILTRVRWGDPLNDAKRPRSSTTGVQKRRQVTLSPGHFGGAHLLHNCAQTSASLPKNGSHTPT